MATSSNTSLIRQGNIALSSADYPRAIRHYVHAMINDERLVGMAEFNLSLAAERLREAQASPKDEVSEQQLTQLQLQHFNEPLLKAVIKSPCQQYTGRKDSAAGALFALIWGATQLSRKQALSILRNGKSSSATADMPSVPVTDVALPSGIYQRILASLEQSPDYERLVGAKLADNEQQIKQRLKQFDDANAPLVSVIMPTYNRSAIIIDAIASVLQQSYPNFELLVCDDGSSDDTEQKVRALDDERVTYLRQANGGAAAARNLGLSKAAGEIVCYLDTDNYWHPDYLKLVVTTFNQYAGRSAVYFDFIDYHVNRHSEITVRSTHRPAFDHERLLKKPFIDLNTFAHKRELYDAFGGFDENLTRRQDYDLMLKYTWLRDPLHVPLFVALYQRNEQLEQITRLRKGDDSCVPIINRKIEQYFTRGLPAPKQKPLEKVSVIIWDHCRNHFSKPYSVAEALSRRYKVELISFDFFDEGIFGPLKDDNPDFETKYFKGADFPNFFEAFKAAMDAVTGDIMYVVKPRVPSLGLAMAVNYQRVIPYVLEINDLETVVSSPKAGDKHKEVRFEDVKLKDKALRSPYSDLWSHLLDPFAKRSPVVITHNKGLDTHYNSNTLYMRNLKDERVYSPGHYDRDRIRDELGYKKDDRIILFGGLLRKHKGIYELVELVERLGDKRYKLLFVGSRPTPDQAKLVEQYKDTITVLPPQDRIGMARINYAADLVILWLNPDVPASHYQFPYKATDAFAMQTPVIANDISDLGDLGRQGYLKLVPFGDWDGMVAQIQQLFSDIAETSRMTDAARRLYMRQFSFNAALGSFELAAQRAKAVSDKPFACSQDFVKWFNLFYHAASGNSDTFIQSQQQRNLQLLNNQSGQSVAGFGEVEVDAHIRFVEPEALPDLNLAGDVVLVQASSAAAGIDAARLMTQRAGRDVTTAVVLSESSCSAQQMNKLLNASVTSLTKVDEFAFPCRDWLVFAEQARNDGLCGAFNGVEESTERGSDYIYGLGNDWRKALTEKTEQQLRPIKALQRKFLIVDSDKAKEYDHSAIQGNVYLKDVAKVNELKGSLVRDICVVMPCIDTEKGLACAARLQAKAGIEADYVVSVDTKRQGFIKTLNQTARVTQAKYVVYLAEDALPGENWLRIAYEQLEQSGKSVLGFNCGKWHGRIAAFGMVRKDWVYRIYDQSILFDGYKSHRADNEITVIARAQDEFVYSVESVLFEDDRGKDFRGKETFAGNFSLDDRNLFVERFDGGFDGAVSREKLAPLESEYINKWIRSQLKKDNFVLYRIIGNDLVPRHKKGQSRENIQFILENEPALPRCEKRFIINRIIDPDELAAIKALLEKYNMPYTVIPFDKKEYDRIGLDTSVLKKLKQPYRDYPEVVQQRIALAMARLKNNYVMNNNGARNAALNDGRKRACWVLPFDGNCFISLTAWQEIRGSVLRQHDTPYHIVPMARITDNGQLLEEGFKPEAIEEPQMLFRHDAKETFNEDFCYGRRPKVEMFWRLGYSGKWDLYIDDKWDMPRPQLSNEAGNYAFSGWIARLNSGMQQLEVQDDKGSKQRYRARADAIIQTLDQIEDGSLQAKIDAVIKEKGKY
jgi:glycosyltransferase involved in cell wall biosynthesis